MIKLLQFGVEGLLILLILIFAYTQLVRPLMKKTPVFPMFRKRPNLERETESINEALADKAQQRDLERKKKKLGVDKHAAGSAVKKV